MHGVMIQQQAGASPGQRPYCWLQKLKLQKLRCEKPLDFRGFVASLYGIMDRSL